MKFDVSGRTPLAEGGEGVLYEHNGKIVKVYKPHINFKSKEKRVKSLIKLSLPREVIKPTECVYDKHNKFIGMIMPKVDGEDFKRLSNKKYVTTNGITTKDVLELLDKLWNTLKILHSNNIYIGDLNDQNILFDLKSHSIYLIDVDSWSIGTEKCEVAMDLFKDPQMVSNNFNESTDTYSFCVLAWKSLTRVHPFGGVMNPDISMMDRIKRGISVIDNPSIKIPRTTKTWANLSPDMVLAFKNVFNYGDRVFGDYISDMLNNLIYCQKDKDYYFGEFDTCPMCNSAARVVKYAVSIGVQDGFKVAAILRPEDVKTAYSEQFYLNNQNEVVDIRSGRSVPYVSGRYLFDNRGNVFNCHQDHIKAYVNGCEYNIPIKYNSYPIIDGEWIYFISDKCKLHKIKVVGTGIANKPIQKCANNSYFNVSGDKYCIVNVYDRKIITDINGYFHEIDYDKKISDVAAHYDEKTNRWLIVIDDGSCGYDSYAMDGNTLIWKNCNIDYKCSVHNICFSNGAIYIPVDGAIRGMNIKTMNYKDFSCSVVDSDSVLRKRNGQFIIINDDNIYRFYK